jgi:catechol 2,3-dioxygenase-like lactoylglutathione lyase family enzyme
MPLLNRRALFALGIAAGSRALLPATARAGTRDAREPGHNPILGTGGGLHHVTVRTRDWQQSLHFYRQVLGFTVRAAWSEHAGTMNERLEQTRANDQRWAYLDAGDGRCIEVFEDPAFLPPAPGESDPTKNACSAVVHFALRTSRVDQVVEHARALGATVLESPVDFTLHTSSGQGPVVVRLCFVQGPSGEWIELVQNPP